MRRVLNFALLFLVVGVFRVMGGALKLFGRGGGGGDGTDGTLRLYRRQDGQREYVWVYEADGQIHVDAGVVGQMADRGVYPADEREAIEVHLAQLRSAGFAEVAPEDLVEIQITYATDDTFAGKAELDKRNALLDDLDGYLALTGQGYWVDASTGMGTMELVFQVVDFDIARSTLEQRLRGTEHGDYLAIGSPEEPGFNMTEEGIPVPA